MPDFLQETSLITLGWNIALIVVAVIAAKIVQMVLVKIFTSKHIFHNELIHCVMPRASLPLLWLLTFFAISIVLPLLSLPEVWYARAALYIKPVIVAILGWLLIGIANGVAEWLEKHYPGKKSRDALGTRRFNTQIRILMRVVITIIIVLTIVGMAMVVPTLRQLGMSMFASAGVAGIVLGIAAKESFSNLIAGAQLALTQQILLGDEVIVNNQSGTIEEITSSYVVIRAWDLRRVVVPLRYFMENSFENLTYHETDMFGAVYLYTDYKADIAALRSEAEHIVKESKFWDGKRFDLLVTDSKENSLQIRITLSAKTSGEVWGLQCETREKLITYLQLNQPEALPRIRMEIKPPEILKAVA